MKTIEVLGVIGSIFGESQRQVLRGDLMGSVAEGLAVEDIRNRWKPVSLLRGLVANSSGSITLSRGWPKVGRDHSRSRHGNQRP